MYISCGDDGTGVESEMGYVPNNPLFGMPLDSPQECAPTCPGCSSCQHGSSTLPLTSFHSADYVDCGNCLDHNGVLSQPNLCGGYWAADDMNTFSGLSPLDMDPLPSLFPFSPCGATYKTERPTHDMADVLLSLKHAVLKSSPEPPQQSHPHPHQHNHHLTQQSFHQNPANSAHLPTIHHHAHGSNGGGNGTGGPALHSQSHMHNQQHQQSHMQHQSSAAPQNFYAHPHQTSLSYTVHPHQMLVSTSPTSLHVNHGAGGCGAVASHEHQQPVGHQQLQSQSQNLQQSQYANGFYETSSLYAAPQQQHQTPTAAPLLPPPPPMYPSMSVNVSMNMTMHAGYGGAPEAGVVPMQCSQMQWTPQTPTPTAAMNVLYPPAALLSPTGHHHHYATSGATYSFTADFRPPNAATNATVGNSPSAACSGVGADPMKMPTAVNGSIAPICNIDGESPSRHSTGAYYHHHHHHHHHSTVMQPLQQPHQQQQQQPQQSHMQQLLSTHQSQHQSQSLQPLNNQQHQQHLHHHHNDLLLAAHDYSPPHSPNVATAYVDHMRDSKSFEALDLDLDGDCGAGDDEDDDDGEDGDDDDDGDATSNDDGTDLGGPDDGTQMQTGGTDGTTAGGDAKPNLCRLCGKTYARPSTLKTHLRTHSGERPYRCPDCNKSFSQAANLTAHVRTHTGQKPFRCPICDRRFSQSSSVTTHMRTHSGERPYRCRSCKKAFSDSSTLTKHLRIHSGEKPYQCKLCLLRFSQSGNLNRHMRVHGTNGNILA